MDNKERDILSDEKLKSVSGGERGDLQEYGGFSVNQKVKVRLESFQGEEVCEGRIFNIFRRNHSFMDTKVLFNVIYTNSKRVTTNSYFDLAQLREMQ